ncbi:MAG: MotA/TolQ/ExbB proton channel family protein [Phycisphaerae bacterium]|nr:MotA/TolQ/ExbB proton channel family protein [Phycisphaerae bacterium]
MIQVNMLAAEGVNFFRVLVVEGGGIGWLLWIISVVVLALGIHYFLNIRRMNILPGETLDHIRELFGAKQYREAIDLTAEQNDFLSYTIHAALSEAPHGYGAMERAMEEAAEERTTRMLRSIEWLNLIGNIGPMLGLLGTVWGMIGAFFTIVELGAPDPKALAGDIGVALVTTLLGLGVSIPALSIYAIMRNRIDALTSEAILAAQELISTFRPTRKRPA